MRHAGRIAVMVLFAVRVFAQTPQPSIEQQALEAWRVYDYATAEKLYRQAIAERPNSGDGHAGLIRSVLDEKKLAQARDAATAAVKAAPESAAVQAAYGDLLYREGRIDDAENAYRRALKLDENLARGWYGLSQIAEITSHYSSARRSVLKAHELDPADPDIYEAWASRLSRAERKRAIEHLIDHHGHMEPERLNILQSRLAWMIVLGNKTAWKLVSTTETAKIKLEKIMGRLRGAEPEMGGRFEAPQRVGGVAVKVRFNDKKTATLLLDTGASGIVLHRGVAGKAELKQVYEIATHGIGDEKPANGYLGWARDVKIGPIEFENVPVTVLEGNFAEGTDGLIGVDVFEHFLITLDIPNAQLELAPLPDVPAELRDEDGTTDRYVAPEMKAFDAVLHTGAHILVPTSVDGKPNGLFFLDTGAFDSQVDPSYISRNKLTNAPNLSVRGLSGSVRDVSLAQNVEIRFGRFVQDNFRIVAISMDKLSDGEGVALTGILGFPLLSQFRMTIDYRDGLVNFEYKNGKR